jgi:hypothetical protein
LCHLFHLLHFFWSRGLSSHRFLAAFLRARNDPKRNGIAVRPPRRRPLRRVARGPTPVRRSPRRNDTTVVRRSRAAACSRTWARTARGPSASSSPRHSRGACGRVVVRAVGLVVHSARERWRASCVARL